MTTPPVQPPPSDDLPLASSPPAPAPPPPISLLLSATPVTIDFLCVQCGYNLRGLPRNRQCPECGRSIQDSYRGDRLDFADPDWVGSLARGVILIQAAAVAAVLAITLLVLVEGRIPTYILAAALAVFSAGVWLVTTGEPRMVHPPVPNALAARIATALTLAAGALMVSGLLSLPSLTTFLLAINSVALGLFLFQLAKRIPNDSLAFSLNNIGWGAAAIFALMAILILLTPGPRSGEGVFTICLVPPLLAFAGPFVAWFLALHFLRRDLRNCTRGGKEKR